MTDFNVAAASRMLSSAGESIVASKHPGLLGWKAWPFA